MRTIANARSAGLALSWLAVLFLLFDSAGKLLQVQPVIDGTLQLGYPRDSVFSLGVILLSCVVAYAIPDVRVGRAAVDRLSGRRRATQCACRTRFSATSVSHVRPALLWGGLILRDARLRALLPIRRTS